MLDQRLVISYRIIAALQGGGSSQAPRCVKMSEAIANPTPLANGRHDRASNDTVTRIMHTWSGAMTAEPTARSYFTLTDRPILR